MATVKTVFIIAGIILGFYFMYHGFKKVRVEGFKFDFKHLFKGSPSFKESSGGLLIAEGLLSWIFSYILYLI